MSDNSKYAFPGFEHFIAGDQIVTGKPYGGLTKRELFAGLAMVGIIAADCNAKDTYRDVADKARDRADALIASLQVQP